MAESAQSERSARSPGHPRRAFPPGFWWGSATASYQIEGAHDADGRGPSIWDTFSHAPGNVVNGETGDVAIDHYHRYRDDVGLMADLGLVAYRFSIAWPRIQPTGAGPVNPAGLDFYQRLVDELLGHGITPWVTLYHWDLPQPLEDAGGWPARDTAARFADYAASVHEALGDRVRFWTTLNEPWCSAYLGYAAGVHAPGRREPGAALAAQHHLLLGHGLAVQAMRAQRAESQFGITLNLYAVSPASQAPEDIDAARRIDGLQNRAFLDPVLLGSYPEDVLRDWEAVGGSAVLDPGDLPTINTSLDLLGVNYYTRLTVAAGTEAGAARSLAWPGSEHVVDVGGGGPVTAMGWQIDPAGLQETLLRVHCDYPELPLYVTENGAAFDDEITEDGRVEDVERLRFVAAHLAACADAIDAGVPLHGYFLWSLLDNFEWSYGYGKRFGIVAVDRTTQRRIVKDSAWWYSQVARANALPASVALDA